MGVVFQARKLSLKRPVALKMILAGQLANETDVKRFRTDTANLDYLLSPPLGLGFVRRLLGRLNGQ
jgi:hypothetical protein